MQSLVRRNIVVAKATVIILDVVRVVGTSGRRVALLEDLLHLLLHHLHLNVHPLHLTVVVLAQTLDLCL